MEAIHLYVRNYVLSCVGGHNYLVINYKWWKQQNHQLRPQLT